MRLDIFIKINIYLSLFVYHLKAIGKSFGVITKVCLHLCSGGSIIKEKTRIERAYIFLDPFMPKYNESSK